MATTNSATAFCYYVNSLRAAKIESYGFDGLLSETFCNSVLDSCLFPQIKEGNIDAGIKASVRAVAERLGNEKVHEEVATKIIERRTKRTFANSFLNYLFAGFLLMIWLAWRFNSKIIKNRKEDNNVRFESTRKLTNWTIFFSIIFPLPMLFLYFYEKKLRLQERQKPFPCPKCQNQMRLLSESEEDTYLESGKQKEESLRSVDHDVWLCNSCGQTKILPYPNRSSNLETCSKCNYRAVKMVENAILEKPTTSNTGLGKRTYCCLNCDDVFEKTYTIPRIDTSSRVGGGGGRGRRRWGGGRSGGGGAGRRF